MWGCCWSHVVFPEHHYQKAHPVAWSQPYYCYSLGPSPSSLIFLPSKASSHHLWWPWMYQAWTFLAFWHKKDVVPRCWCWAWDVPGSSCIFPASALESAFFPMILSSFWWKTEFRCETWHQVWHCYWCAIVYRLPQQRYRVEASMSVWIYCLLTAVHCTVMYRGDYQWTPSPLSLFSGLLLPSQQWEPGSFVLTESFVGWNAQRAFDNP